MANADELREMILANPNPYMSQDFAVVLGAWASACYWASTRCYPA
jgi:hypothetical protein